MTSRLYNKDYIYPKQAIDDSWEKVLLNQFHNVLPGSAIGMVYEDSEKLYEEVCKDGEALLDKAFSVLFPDSVTLNASANLKALPPSGKIVSFKTTFFCRSNIIQVTLLGANSGLKSQVLQTLSNGTVGYAVVNTLGNVESISLANGRMDSLY
ncbi:hypothetical protein C0995_015517 [Termitomyces sp. Mi166|nr:hypothetical protein C0995_015517 [Termitomyces sp. Mi166\